MARCTLCGGKLNGEKRCTFCGLDNTKNDDMYKHMVNRSSCASEPLTHVHEEPEPRRTQSRPQPIKVKPVERTVNTYKKPKKGMGCVTIIGMIPFIIAIIGFIVGMTGGIISEIVPEPDYFFEEEIENEYDSYEWVIDEMPEEGEYFSTYLYPGIYEVGYHIPMGKYEISASPGIYSNIEIYDEWNEIFISEFLNGDSDVSSVTDVLLFDGAYLLVLSGSEVSLFTENAQPISVGGVQNESQEAIELNGQLVAGEDFEPGTYDIIYKSAQEQYSYLEVMITTDVHDYSFYITFDDTMGEETFYNVPLPEGAIIEVDESQLEGVEELYMIPSEFTSDSALENFYYAY